MRYIKPKKRFGQHYLRDDNVLMDIRDVFRENHKSPYVLEIGPGMGILSKELIDLAKNVTAVEIDQRLVEYLATEYSDVKNFEVIHHDFLTFDIESLSKKSKRKIKVIGNVPYHITSQILIHLFENFKYVQDLTLTIQKEVAERLLSPPGTKGYGIISVYSVLFSEPSKLFNISRGVFNPPPKVESTVIHMKFRESLPKPVSDLKLLISIIRTTFGKRRKMLRNSIKPIGECVDFLEGEGFDLTRRPESLNADEFINLSNVIHKWLKDNQDV